MWRDQRIGKKDVVVLLPTTMDYFCTLNWTSAGYSTQFLSLNFTAFEKLDFYQEKSTRPNVQERIEQNSGAPLKHFCPRLWCYSIIRWSTSPDEKNCLPVVRNWLQPSEVESHSPQFLYKQNTQYWAGNRQIGTWKKNHILLHCILNN